MPPIPPQIVQIDCPACGTRYRANVYTIVDVTQQPELKQDLLAGRLNVGICPQCSYSLLLGAPLVYHDASKELFLAFFPQEIGMSAEDQERFLGDATRALMSTMLADTPRGYMLTPKRFISLMSLVDTILEADGIPREVMEQQRQRIDLIGQMLQVMHDEQQLAALVQQHREALNYEFFATIGAFIEASNQENRPEAAQQLGQLHEVLLRLTGIDASQLQPSESAEVKDLIEQLSNVSEEDLETMVAQRRAALDYSFFQSWTTRIEQLEQAGKHEEAQRMTERRARILETLERLDKEVQDLLESRDGLLREVLAAPDARAALEGLGDQLDEAFIAVVTLNLATLQQAGGQEQTVARLEAINQLAVEVLQERLPPEERFINALLLANSHEESVALMRQNAAMVTTDFVKKLNELADEQEKQGVKANAERLRQLARAAGPLLF